VSESPPGFQTRGVASLPLPCGRDWEAGRFLKRKKKQKKFEKTLDKRKGFCYNIFENENYS
jgi:hypothetical protein